MFILLRCLVATAIAGKHRGRAKRSTVSYSLYRVRGSHAHSTGGRERPAAPGVGIQRPDAGATRSSSSCTEAASTLLAQAMLWKPNAYLGGVGRTSRTIPLAKSCFDEAGQISAGRNPISGIDVRPPGKNDNVRCPLAVQ